MDYILSLSFLEIGGITVAALLFTFLIFLLLED